MACIYGVGTSEFGRFPERRVEELAWTAILEALEDAGVEREQIDALFVGSVFGPAGVATRIQRAIGLGGIPAQSIEAACASSTVAFNEAVAAVDLGRYECVLVVGIEQLSTLFTGAIVPEATDAEGASGLPMPGLYALQAQRYIHDHGAPLEHLAAVAVKNKAHGAHNERAQLRGSLPTAEEVLGSRMIAEPLTLLQCCPISDGAGAVVIGRPRGNSRDVRVLGCISTSGELWDHRSQDEWGRPSVARTAELAYRQAGVSADEVDVFEVHDAFTIGEIVTLEALGLCGRGEGHELAVSGHTRLGGRQPVNPSGGLLTRGHPLGATGTAQLAEVVWQLRGIAGGRQVPGAQLGVVETMGGGASGMDGNTCVVTVLGR
jgi:acetyl-CoA C-acetyltransferase